MKKRQIGPCVTFFPQPTTLIATCDEAGAANLMTASWVGIVSKTPPTLAVALHHKRKSYENLLQGPQAFTVNMVPASLATQADFCGLKSGRQADKVALSGLTLSAAAQGPVPLVAECPLNVECRVVGEQCLGEYRLVLGEIVEIHAAEAAFNAEGVMDARVFDPLVYLGGIREYWSLGERAGQAYEDGKRLFPPSEGG
ncbi:flavin reductase family protein [Geoalkalibacter halelectricus]|uniref:Flavin reductase family protein n=1 Tax=Geoalkalibacter halelectricus TaxID=2847045 RepID=A0ABY5ZL44_9BACT|nr:flavin reductase family protein [Geoalkalibacter halelectricus]MDO3379649.1 flavin reductase family protein [Geoalkalibacter halelectricus]UWZ78535.1 flavin reductase family protein [Geoalkalibacter halelectricus]